MNEVTSLFSRHLGFYIEYLLLIFCLVMGFYLFTKRKHVFLN